MRKILVSVWDKKAKSYGPILAYAAEAVAVREFGEVACDEKSTLSKYPGDFELHAVGSFDEMNEGQPVQGYEPIVIVTAQAVIAARASGPALTKEA